MIFDLIQALPQLQLVLYTDEEVWAALEPLCTIPAYTEVLNIEPPEPPKRKRDTSVQDPMSKPAADMVKEEEEDKDVKPGSSDAPTTASLLPSLPEVLVMFMGCNTADEFSSLLEYLQLNGGGSHSRCNGQVLVSLPPFNEV